MTRSDWRPGADVARARQRARMLARARDYFARNDVLEVQTPVLSAAAVSDRHIESLTTTVLGQTRFLRTSPEYPMKRLLAAGYPDIYEIGAVFRDGESGARHQPEFQMIEWYRHDFSLQAMIEDTLALLRHLLDTPGSALFRQLRSGRQWRFDAALQAALGADSLSDTDHLAVLAGDDVAKTLGHDHDALLDYLFDDAVARRFEPDALSVVSHYPASQAALARLCPRTGLALRFEVYCGPLELANGFVELQSADEQRTRFEADQAWRRQHDLPLRPLDEAFLAALESGLPDCAGVAVGLERLLMLAGGEPDIRSLVSFPHQSESP